MKRVGLFLLLVTVLLLAGTAQAGELLSREEVARCYANGHCTILKHPSAFTFDDGRFYGLGGSRVVAVIVPCRRGAELSVWVPQIPGFRFSGHLDGFTTAQLREAPYAGLIARAIAPLLVDDRPVPPTPTPVPTATPVPIPTPIPPPTPVPTPAGPPDALDLVSRSLGISRLQVLPLLLVGVAVVLLVALALVEIATKLLTTLSEIYAKHRVLKHAATFLHHWKNGGS